MLWGSLISAVIRALVAGSGRINSAGLPLETTLGTCAAVSCISPRHVAHSVVLLSADTDDDGNRPLRVTTFDSTVGTDGGWVE